MKVEQLIVLEWSAWRTALHRCSLALLFLLTGASAGLFGSAAIAADAYPSRLIRIVVPFAAGGPMDVIARPLAEEMQRSLGVPVVVENRAGANGITGSDAVAKADPDGYTLLLTTGSHIGNAVFNSSQLRYDPMADFRPIAGIYDEKGDGLLLVVSKELKAKSLADLLQIGKTRPEGLTFAHSGIGNITQLAGELLRYLGDTKMLGVPFRGTGVALPELIAGRVDFLFGAVSAVKAAVDGGEVAAIASSGSRRSTFYPDVPTLVELGYPDFIMVGYFGLYLPAKAPETVSTKLYQTIVKAMASPTIQNVLKETGGSSNVVPGEEFVKFLGADLERQKKLVGILNLKVN